MAVEGRILPARTPPGREARPAPGRSPGETPHRQRPPATGLRHEAGLSVVEELVALAIMSLVIVLLLSMLSTGLIGVRTVDERVLGETLAASQLEAVKDFPYQADPTAMPYPTIPAPPEYGIGVAVEFWVAPNGPFTTSLRNDGLQLITVTVSRDGETVGRLADYKVDR